MLKVGLIGMGWWGGTLLRVLQGSPDIKIVAATDIDPAKDALAAERGARFLPSFEAVLDDPEVEGVVLCTPQQFHAGQIVAAASRGKHVFCEKPLCLTRADAETAVAVCRANKVVLGVGHERRFEPPIIDMMKRIKAGELGTIVQVEANFSQDKFLALPKGNWRISASNPVGPVTATGVHLLDLSTAILGPCERVLTSLRTLATEWENGDTLALTLNFKNGSTSLLSAILTTPFDGRIAVYGSKGWAEVRDKAHPENSEGWTATYVIRDKPREDLEYPPAPAVRANLEAFARAAAGGEPYPIEMDQMIDTVAALEAVFVSAQTNELAVCP
ncbi:Gfo/Idh/MocA family protein [Aquabacter spiritensis]|uniref:Putative dehydrogenase n=1 Tax=Aquabacter spiritensis TaxID=933073 RepID=A0A4V2UYA8_9HYPH|nr:Gfo/Idh/MocA family oxidoreductase [Aquabacter spiritensis]TCT06688.1 putative dehydrogenase [Aquabacter spiritensis]